MSRTSSKLMLAAIFFLLGALLSGLVLQRVAALEASFRQGADPASALHIVPNEVPNLHIKVEWHPDAPDTGRTMDDFTRTQVGGAYLRAWLQENLSYLRGEPYGLRTYFVGPALHAVSDTISATSAQGWHIHQTNTAHHLTINFYAADGSIVSFTDEQARIAQIIYDDTGELVYAGDMLATYDVVMTLEDGIWCIRHRVQQARVHPDDLSQQRHDPPPPDAVRRDGRNLQRHGQPYRVAGVNYYPQDTPWNEFWPNYDPQIIEQDFALIRSLNLNTIRIFVPFEQFGGPTVQSTMLDHLNDLLDQAAAHDLTVIVTLFDFRSEYTPLRWPEADRHLETLLTRFADHPAVLAWDIKNEPDRDYATAGEAVVNAWLRHTLSLARQYAPHHLLTIGWSTPQAAHMLADDVDVVSFHFYAPAAELPAAYANLRADAPQRPIVLTEFGLPTWNSWLFPHGHTEAEQAQYYADTLAALRCTDSAGYLSWMLYDVTHVPPSVAGYAPWQNGPQRHLGIVRHDATLKPAAALLARDAVLDVRRVPVWARFVKPFWLTCSALLVLMTGASYYLRRTRG